MFKRNGFFAGIGLLAAASGMVLLSENSSYAASRADFANNISAKNSQEVWDMLTVGGIGACRVALGNTTCCACKYYFVTGVTDGQGYNGAPVYNTDADLPNEPNNAYYAGDATASRQTPTSPVSVQHSTGCFPQAGYGPWAGGATAWGGNNTAEVTQDAKEYAKALVINLIQDGGDPCKIDPIIAGMGSAMGAESLVTSNRANLYFGDRGDGKPNPKKCYVRTGTMMMINGAQTTVFSALNADGRNDQVCKAIFRRLGAVAGNVPLITDPDKILANAIALHQSIYTGAVKVALDAAFQGAATANPTYLTQTSSSTLSTVNMSAAGVPLSTVNLSISALLPRQQSQ